MLSIIYKKTLIKTYVGTFSFIDIVKNLSSDMVYAQLCDQELKIFGIIENPKLTVPTKKRR
jgi:hypothetical protein